MQYQLRDYRIKPGEVDEWMAAWSTRIRPLREEFGFRVMGAWLVAEQDRFIWILGREDFAAADERYYESAARASIQPDPARHLASSEHAFIEPVDR